MFVLQDYRSSFGMDCTKSCGCESVAFFIELEIKNYIVLKCMHTVYKCTCTVYAVHIYSTGPHVH